MAELEVLYEDNHLLVLNKPPLLATMGAAPGKPSLLEQAKSYLKRKYDKPGNVYLGIVSRLDSFTSGVMIMARTSKAAARLTDQFREGTVRKQYWAILPDRLPSDSGRLEHIVYKDDRQKRMIAIPTHRTASVKGAKIAKLSYSTIARSEDLTLVEIELETGRKHQIRVQFSQLGCPVVGDRKYGSRHAFPKGIALHSKSLKVIHPTQKTVLSFESVPPKWWNLQRFGIR